jgi:hypothetical protein
MHFGVVGIATTITAQRARWAAARCRCEALTASINGGVGRASTRISQASRSATERATIAA